MSQKLLANRYEFTRDGQAIIDISVEAISDLFNSFDRKAAFSRRDLDQDFVDYLVDCVKEVGKNDFIMRITIEHEFNMLQENTLRKAVKNHFAFAEQQANIRFRTEMRKFLLLMILGISLLALVSKYKIPDTAQVELWVKTLYEGTIIASWVAIWEAMTSIFFCWSPYFAKKSIFHRLMNSEIQILNKFNKISL